METHGLSHDDALYIACQNGDLNAVDWAISLNKQLKVEGLEDKIVMVDNISPKKYSRDYVYAEGMKCIHIACFCGHTIIVKVLLKHGWKVDRKLREIARKFCKKDLIRFINLSQTDHEFRKLLEEWGQKNKFLNEQNRLDKLAKIISDDGAVCSIKSQEGMYALHMACKNGVAKKGIDLIYKQYPNAVRKTDSLGNLPLHHAIKCKETATVRLLIEKYVEGCKAKNVLGDLPVHCVGKETSIENLGLAINAFYKGQEARNERGDLPLHSICRNQAPLNIVQELIHAYPDACSLSNINGNLPLHIALSHQCKPEVIQCLVTNYPDAMMSPNLAGDLPLHVSARVLAHDKIMDILLEQGKSNDEIPALAVRNEAGDLPAHIIYEIKIRTEKALVEKLAEGAPDAARLMAKENRAEQLLKKFISRYPNLCVGIEVAFPWKLCLEMLKHNRNMIKQLFSDVESAETVAELNANDKNSESLRKEAEKMRKDVSRRKKEYSYGKKNRSLLHVAVSHSCPKKLLSEILDSEEVDSWLTSVDVDGCTPLHLAIKLGNSNNTIKLLLKKNQTVASLPDQNGNTPLHLYVTKKNADFELLDLLLDAFKPAVVKRNGSGRVPFSTAQFYDAPQWLLEELLRRFIPVACLIEAEFPLASLQKVLREMKGSVNVRNGRGETASHIAMRMTAGSKFTNKERKQSREDYIFCLAKLLYKYVRKDAKDKYGKTPRVAAMKSKNKRIKEWGLTLDTKFGRYLPAENMVKHYASNSVELYHGIDNKTKRNIVMKFYRKEEVYKHEQRIFENYKFLPKYVLLPQDFCEESQEPPVYIPSWESQSQYCMISPRATMTLKQKILSDGAMALKEAKEIATQIGKSINHIHNKKVVHGDIEPSNVVFHDGRWKICDFDGAAEFPNGGVGKKYTEAFCPVELAQVIFNNRGKKEVFDEQLYISPHLDSCSKTYDIWGFGCIVFTICSRPNQYSLFSDAITKPSLTIPQRKRLREWTNIDDLRLDKILKGCPDLTQRYLAMDLIAKCLQGNQENRFQSMGEVLKHPFFCEDSPLPTHIAAAVPNEKIHHSLDLQHLSQNHMYSNGSYAIIIAVDNSEQNTGMVDSSMLKSSLIQHGFNVLKILVNEEASLTQINELMDLAMNTMRKKKKARFFLYISMKSFKQGNGIWLAPYAANVEQMRKTMLSFSTILEFLSDIEPVHQLLLLDCPNLEDHLRNEVTTKPLDVQHIRSPFSGCIIRTKRNKTDISESRMMSALVSSFVDALSDQGMTTSRYVTSQTVFNTMQRHLKNIEKQTINEISYRMVHERHKRTSCAGQILFFNPTYQISEDAHEVHLDDDSDDGDHFELHIDDHDDHRDRNIERERETQELKRVFLLLDTNMDGTVSKKEVMKVMMEQQEAYFILRNSKYLSGLAHVRKWAAIFDNIDGDHNGDLSIDELLKYVSERSFELKRNALSTEEGKELRRVFDLIDTDGSNTVTRKEVMKAMMEQGKAYEALRSSEYLREFASVKKWALMFDKMDDGDGAITISELISYVAIRAAHRKPPKPEKSPRSPQNKSVPTLDNMKPIDLAKIEDNIEHTPTISAKPEKLSESRKGSETVMDLTNEMDDHVEIDAKETGDDAKETEDDAKEDVGEPINGSSDSKKRSEAVMVETNSASLDEKESDLDMTEGAADAASNANDNDELASFELRDVKKEAKER